MSGRAQRGVVLLITLIMLTAVTLIGSVSASIVIGNAQVVQNAEARAVVKNNALSALQEAILTRGFLEGEGAFVVGCQGSRYARCFDMNGDNVADNMIVTLSEPNCISAIPVRNSSLKVWSNAREASCYQPGIYSLCADALWEVTVIAEDQVTGASVEIRQGLRTRTSANLVSAACG